MKTITPRALLLGASLLGAATFVSTTVSAEAAPRYGQRRPGRRPFNRLSNFNGVVTNVRSSTNFDIRVGGGKTYNVYTISRTPRRLNAGDRVRVSGRPMYSNDIRDASVTIIRNR